MITVGSLFSGIGGIDAGLERAGMRVVWQAETDPHASRVLARHWPHVPNLGDVTTIDWSSVERPDLVCGGYPCQPFSFAGRRAGADDPRHLWPWFARALRVLRPRYALLENVAGHLGLGFAAVLADLAEAGFDAEWAVVRASDVGAPHRRERLFVLAHARGQRCDGWASVVRDGRRPAERGEAGGHAVDGRSSSSAADADYLGRQRLGRPRGRREGPADGGEPAADTEDIGRGQGRRPGAVQGCEVDERTALQPGGRGDALPADTDVAGLEGCQPAQRRDMPSWGDYEPAIRRWKRALGRAAPAPTDPRGRLSVAFVEWMMGFDPGWVDGLTRTAALRCLGNAVVPRVVEWIAPVLLDAAG